MSKLKVVTRQHISLQEGTMT